MILIITGAKQWQRMSGVTVKEQKKILMLLRIFISTLKDLGDVFMLKAQENFSQLRTVGLRTQNGLIMVMEFSCGMLKMEL